MVGKHAGQAAMRLESFPWWGVLPLGLLVTACATGRQQERYDALYEALRVPEIADGEPASEQRAGGADRLFEGEETLERDELVRLVLLRNPDIEAARHAARAALAQYEQATALPDPMAEYMLAPLSVAGDNRFGQRITLSQRFPWPGKLSARGDVELAEAEAAAEQYRTAQLDLALAAASLFEAYYANQRSLALLEEHDALMENILEAARTQYAAGLASQQEPLQADVELAHVAHRRVILEAEREVIVAQLNALLHREPQLPIPPPPTELEVVLPDVGEPEELQRIALERRPEMEAIQARLRARHAAIDVAELAYWPDFGVMGSYNSMWMDTAHQWMLGVSLEIPLQLGRRSAAVDEAEALLAAERAEIASVVMAIRAEVETARQRLMEQRHVIQLYQDRLLPTAQQQIEAARIAYSTGRGNFQALIDAERTLRRLQLEYEEAVARLQQRGAELERTLGRTAGEPGEEVAR